MLRGVGAGAEPDVAVDSASSKPQLPPNERGQEVSREELPDGRISVVRQLEDGTLVEVVIENRTGVAVRRLNAKQREAHERLPQLARQYELRKQAFRLAADYAKQLAAQGEELGPDHPMRNGLPDSAKVVKLSHPQFDSTRPYIYSSLLLRDAKGRVLLNTEDLREPPLRLLSTSRRSAWRLAACIGEPWFTKAGTTTRGLPCESRTRFSRGGRRVALSC